MKRKIQWLTVIIGLASVLVFIGAIMGINIIAAAGLAVFVASMLVVMWHLAALAGENWD